MSFRPALHYESGLIVQPKSSFPIGAKVEINPQGLYTIFKAELEKKKIQSAPSY
jgi:hypothetical protein